MYSWNIQGYIRGIEGGLGDQTILFVVDTTRPTVNFSFPGPLYSSEEEYLPEGYWDDLPEDCSYEDCNTIDSITVTSDTSLDECEADIIFGDVVEVDRNGIFTDAPSDIGPVFGFGGGQSGRA